MEGCEDYPEFADKIAHDNKLWNKQHIKVSRY